MRMFKQITYRERVMISRLRNCGLSISEIAQKIGKNKSSVSRELKRNAGEKTEYSDGWIAEEAQRIKDSRTWIANQTRRRKKLKTKLWVIEQLKNEWSPEQIAGRSKKEAPEKISHECIYQIVIQDKKEGGKLNRLLKRFRKKKSRLVLRKYTKIPKRPSIKQRPKIVDRLKRIGDLEADLIQGYRAEGYVLTVIDRKSQLVVLRKLNTKHKNLVSTELQKALKAFRKTHTLTVDNGKEFYDYKEVQIKSKIKMYFSDPYCSTQRARVENMNGLIRYYLPKKISFKSVTQNQLNIIARKLNHRPRKTLNFLTPKEVHNSFLKNQRCI